MARPTTEQLKRINELANTALKEDQVYVFRSLAADTLPVSRYGWFGEYAIHMTSKMLADLKKDYRTGVGLLASHNSNRLPFGRTFDAVTQTDKVGDSDVETLYIDHYMVTYVDGANGERTPLRTEINGMTTEDIANHVEVGHAFDTSIGFMINTPLCSCCGNDIRDYEKCSHLPGMQYDILNEDGTQRSVRCDIIADGGEGLENSLVYAGAVNRAIVVQNDKDSNSFPTFTKENDETAYIVDDIKRVPTNAQLMCRLSKNSLQLFTLTAERQPNFANEDGGLNTMSQTQEPTVVEETVSKAEFDKAVEQCAQFTAQIEELKTAHAEELATKTTEIESLQAELTAKNEEIAELSVKAAHAETFTEDLIQETLSAGVAAFGNAYNKDRQEKYLRTLSVEELKAEFASLKGEFAAPIEAARATKEELEDGPTEVVAMSLQEMKVEAAKRAVELHKSNGGDLAELTKAELAKLQAASK